MSSTRRRLTSMRTRPASMPVVRPVTDLVRRAGPLDPKRFHRHSSGSPATLEQVTKEAMDLSSRQKLALAGFLLERTEAATDLQSEAAWESEIADRIRAIDEGWVTGVAYEDVMRSAEAGLVP